MYANITLIAGIIVHLHQVMYETHYPGKSLTIVRARISIPLSLISIRRIKETSQFLEGDDSTGLDQLYNHIVLIFDF